MVLFTLPGSITTSYRWSEWSSWSVCDYQCPNHTGSTNRTRTCDMHFNGQVFTGLDTMLCANNLSDRGNVEEVDCKGSCARK